MLKLIVHVVGGLLSGEDLGDDFGGRFWVMFCSL